MTVLDLLLGQVSSPSAADSFATVVSVSSSGVTLRFDGATASGKAYKCNSGVKFRPGDRVKVDRDSGTYVVAYPVGDPQQGGEVHGIPDGGTAGQVLAKNSATAYDVKWTDPPGVPSGGSDGQVLTKNGSVSGSVKWSDIPKELPSGGTSGQILQKNSATAYDVKWADPSGGVPSGGSAGQVLTRVGSTSGAAQWQDAPRELPTGGSAGQVLAKNSSANYDVMWTTPGGGDIDQLKNGNYTVSLTSGGNLQPPQNTTYKIKLASSTYPFTSAYVQDVTTYGSVSIAATKTGTTPKLGFFGTTPVAKQTLSSSATLTQLITALKNYGLFG